MLCLISFGLRLIAIEPCLAESRQAVRAAPRWFAGNVQAFRLAANMRTVKNRRSLTPEIGIPAATGSHPARRGGARHEVTDRVHIVGKNMKTRDGWALNISRGGVRAILEEGVELGEEYEITIGDEGANGLTRRGRVVWVQEEPDGVIAGFEFFAGSSASDVPATKPDDDD